MRRLVPILLVMFALLAYAPAAAGANASARATPRESYESTGFDAYSSVCGAQTCTDTYVFAEQQTTGSGETFSYVCADQFTYNIRTGRGNGAGGCAENPDLTVAGDLSSASLGPTAIEVCNRGHCDTIVVSAELQATGPTGTFRSRHVEKDGTCTYTYSDSGERRFATGSITFDGDTMAADGSIFSVQSTFSSRCK